MVKTSSSLRALIVTAAFLSLATATSTSASAGFVSSDSKISFALNIPQLNTSNDLYFTLSGPASASWLAVGMGSSQMADSLFFMIYSDSSGMNVTLSPRLVYNEVEPSYTNISVTVFPGSTITNDTMTVNALCRNCRSWNGGSIDPTNTAAQFTFAVGPGGSIKSNSGSANLKRHAEYGSFTMDLTKAVGSGGVPVALKADSVGTTQTSLTEDQDVGPPLHAVLMVLVFVGLMPFGIVLLRVLDSPRWHGINQTISAVVALAGFGLGIYISLLYNRSKNFNSAHQIIGFIVIAAMIAQWILGLIHHRQYMQTKSPTKLAPFHVWLGRFVILLGVINGFLGFPLALNSKDDWALFGVVLFVIIVLGLLAFWRLKRNNAQTSKVLASADDGEVGYQAQPWSSQGTGTNQSDVNLRRIDTCSTTTKTPMHGQASTHGRQFV